MVSALPRIFGIFLAGNVIIYSGLAFINGRLLPGLLAPVYRHSGTVSRTLVMVALSALPVNLIFAAGFRMAPAAIGSMAALSALVVVLLAYTLLLDGPIPARAWIAAAAAILAGAWFGFEVSRR